MTAWSPQAIAAHLLAIAPGTRGYIARCQVLRSGTPDGDRFTLWRPGHCTCGPADLAGLTLAQAIAALVPQVAP